MLPDWQLPPGTDRALWDYVRNEQMARSYDERLAGTPLLHLDLKFAEEHFKEPGRLIDLGCGTGRLLVPFAKRGFTCLGVDLSDSMLEIVAEKARNEMIHIRCLKANLVNLVDIADSTFDYAACLFSTLGMIRGSNNRRKFLQHVRRILRPNGLFIVHVHNRRFRFGRGLGKRGGEKGDRTMPQAYGGAALTLHHFTRGEITKALCESGFTVRLATRIGLTADGRLKQKWFFPAIRTYGYLLLAEVAK